MWDQVYTFFQPSLQAVLQKEETQQPDLVLAVSTVVYIKQIFVFCAFLKTFFASMGQILFDSLSLIYAIIIYHNSVLCIDLIFSHSYEMTSKNNCLFMLSCMKVNPGQANFYFFYVCSRVIKIILF